MSDLTKRLIRLAHENPELRPHLLPTLKEAAEPNLVASNGSYYSWEYTNIDRTAYLQENNGNLRLKIKQYSSSTGANPYNKTTTLKDVVVGTVLKPDIRKVLTLLKEFSLGKGKASRGFSRQWADANGKEDTLSNIIKAYRLTKMPTAAQDVRKRKMILKKIQSLSGADLDRVLAAL